MQDITLADVERALRARSPDLAQLVVRLASSRGEPKPRTSRPSWSAVVRRHRGAEFRRLDREQRRARRVADWAEIEAPEADADLPDRLKLHRVLMALWEDGGAYARQQLLRVVADVPLRLGAWRAVKRIFKEAEARGDWEIYGALAARLDMAYAGRVGTGSEVDRSTIRYLVRRAWRRLRELGHRLPAAYPDAAVAVLRHYDNNARFERTWIANQILFHDDAGYNRSRFLRTHFRAEGPALQYRAFGETWRRTPRPLFTLLEVAGSEVVRSYAAEALRSSFRTQLREAEPAWVERLLGVGSPSVDRFAVWLLDNVPRFQPDAFRALGLHEEVLGLLGSSDAGAAAWAAGYARTHARDLDTETLCRLANSPFEPVRQLSGDLLRDRDPRTEVGLEVWGRLLGTPRGHALAVEALQENFSARELGLDWFRERFLSRNPAVVSFVRELLPRVHPEGAVPASFWASLLDEPSAQHLAREALDALEARLAVGAEPLDPDVVRRALMRPDSRGRVQVWVREGRIAAASLGAGWLRALADERTWEATPWVAALKESDHVWARNLTFDKELAGWALDLLKDARAFSPEAVGFDWLFDMVQRTESRDHRFASEVLTRSFLPAAFAPPGSGADPGAAAMAGAERLWAMATDPGPPDDPLRRFALFYLRRHHAGIHEAETDRPLEAGAELPAAFLTFARARALCADGRAQVRELGLLWLRWELARWSPPMAEIALLCELPHREVREFVELALTADTSHAHRRYRIDPDTLTVEGTYRFCESTDPATRALGMRLVSQHPRLSVPEELFRLTGSPDRAVRAFAVRRLWQMYRDRGTSPGWRPPEDAAPPKEAPGARRARGKAAKAKGAPPPVALERPAAWPASAEDLGSLLRQGLFGVPPGRAARGEAPRLHRLPSRRAKLSLIEVCRDLAVEDRAFAELVRPLFEEFLDSRSTSEFSACLVALTRIRARWGTP